ncbi:glycosyltransferase [Duganella sp. FT80W]|uniref:Glycosyltransferase n=1 Tax=Duganella guangzhouensis TaxID=2666084 RepID=A0A6I2KW20_9BURK|nr:glycosyltransferase family A protein [Duganella guangzhouensis]MRW89951.1 glycosyltransferase [Duganella guangzhouensis]
MAPALNTIDICIATYRRPALLGALLAALALQDRRGMALRLIVIDNDQHGTAHAAAQAGAAQCGLPLLYQIEPRQNIALARNRALWLSAADYIVFIDDDETPAPGWLAALLDCCRRCDADLVFGPVDSVLPADAPAWAHACFSKPALATGALLRYGGAGNVLLRRSVLAQPGLWFDPGFGLTGGEDLDWFYRLHLAGKRLVWCAEASASEAVPAARLQLRWARRRAFRGGQTYYRVVVRRRPWRRRLLWFGAKALQLLLGLALAPLLRCASYPAFVRLTLRLAGAAGQLSRCLLPYDYEEYHARRQG